LQHVIVPKTKHAPASAPEECVADLVFIGFVVLAAIDFDDQPRSNAREICEIWWNGVLPTEIPTQLPQTEAVPQMLLGIGWVEA
jgi:hypothetical protein